MLPLVPQQSCSAMESLHHAPPHPGAGLGTRCSPPSLAPKKEEVSQYKKQAVLTFSVRCILVCTWLRMTCSASWHHALYNVALNQLGTLRILLVSPFPSQMIS